MPKQVTNTYEGKPCRKCGSTIRYKSSKACKQCALARSKDWYNKNPEKWLEYGDKHRQKQKALIDGSVAKETVSTGIDPAEVLESLKTMDPAEAIKVLEALKIIDEHKRK